MSNPLATQLKLKLDELNRYAVLRRSEYGLVTEQLDLLYHDVQQGYFGEAAKQGAWVQRIAEIKQQYPKPDIDALKAEIDALMQQVDITTLFAAPPTTENS